MIFQTRSNICKFARKSIQIMDMAFAMTYNKRNSEVFGFGVPKNGSRERKKQMNDKYDKYDQYDKKEQTISFATIGTSKITEKFLEEAQQNENFHLHAVYSRSMKKAEAFAQKYAADRHYDNLDDLAADQEVKAVYIASPNAMHYEQVMKMIEAGKHVLCEKPVASNFQEAEQMFKLADQHHTVLMEAMRSLHDPDFACIKNNIHKLGTVRRATFRFCQYSSRYDDFKAGGRQNIFDPKCSGGALMDLGVYCIEPMVALFGKPQALQATSVMLSGDIDGTGTILADYKDMIAELVYSKITDSDLPSEIQGEQAVMTIKTIANPGEIEIRYYNGQTEKPETEPCDSNLKYEIQAFVDAVNGKKDVTDFRNISLQSMNIMDRARKICGIRFPADRI